MNRIKILSIFIIGVIAITATLGVVVHYSASAAADSDQEEKTSRDTPADLKATTARAKSLRSSYSDEDLAAALGITVEELQTARDTAYAAGLEQAVEQGLITQTQANELMERGGATFPLGDRARVWLINKGIDFEALLADALDITVEELQAAKTAAFTAAIDQAVADGVLTQEQADLMKGRYALRHDDSFLSSMKSAYETAIAQAVEDGVITQAQADLLLENASDLGSRIFDRVMDRRNFQPGQGRGMRDGRWFRDSSTDPETPTTTP